MIARIATSALLAPVVIGLVWWHFIATTVLIVAVAAFTSFEISRLVAGNQSTRQRLLAPIGAVLLVLLPAVSANERWWLGVLIGAVVLIGGPGWPVGIVTKLFSKSNQRFADWALIVSAGGYSGALLCLVVVLRMGPNGIRWTLFALLVTWAYDSAAFAAGRTLGRHAFMAHISPRKTWEGVAGGTIASILVTAAFLPILPIEGWQVVPLGLLWSAAAQTGDLVASMLKRDAGVKDSGTVIPGHGGMLDRVDAFLFVVPCVLVVASLIG